MDRVGVGIGVIILNPKNQILLGLRKGRHGGLYSIPGGMLDFGETFEDCAKRESWEETGLTLSNVEVVAVTNNLKTAQNERIHNVSIIVVARDVHGTAQNREPDKCAGWSWYDLDKLPEPIFEGSLRGIECLLQGKHY